MNEISNTFFEDVLNLLNNARKNGSSWVIVGEKHPQPQHLC